VAWAQVDMNIEGPTTPAVEATAYKSLINDSNSHLITSIGSELNLGSAEVSLSKVFTKMKMLSTPTAKTYLRKII